MAGTVMAKISIPEHTNPGMLLSEEGFFLDHLTYKDRAAVPDFGERRRAN